MTIRYVRTIGPDKGLKETGLSWKQAYNTISEANAASKPGDIINVAAGKYKPYELVTTDDLTFNFAKGAGIDCKDKASYAFRILSDGVTVNGGTFENSSRTNVIVEQAVDVTLNGIISKGAAGHGLYVVKSDYFELHDSGIFGNAQLLRAAGISVHIPTVADNNPGYHMQFTGNAIHNNGPVALDSKVPEGSGALFDYDFWRRGGGDYQKPVLFQDNDVYDNAWNGLYAFHADWIVVADNRFHGNSRQKGDAEIAGSDAFEMRLIRNVITADDDHFTFKGTQGGTLRAKGNQWAVEDDHTSNGISLAAGWKVLEAGRNKVVPFVDHSHDAAPVRFAAAEVGVHEETIGVHAAALEHIL